MLSGHTTYIELGTVHRTHYHDIFLGIVFGSILVYWRYLRNSFSKLCETLVIIKNIDTAWVWFCQNIVQWDLKCKTATATISCKMWDLYLDCQAAISLVASFKYYMSLLEAIKVLVVILVITWEIWTSYFIHVLKQYMWIKANMYLVDCLGRWDIYFGLQNLVIPFSRSGCV